ncbi:MAG: hypothetical protein IRY88_08415 [Rubrobacteraceae bacterium]|nr:hypothetical protein [Rubrobacteraceae bacterium]
MFGAFVRAAWRVLVGVVLLVFLQRFTGWMPLSDDPTAVSEFLSALAQFAAVPVTLAFAVIVLVIQLQAGSLTTRAGALVVNSSNFLFTVAVLITAPTFSILLLGLLDFGGREVGSLARQVAFAAVVPVVLTFYYLARFTNDWFRQVSPAAFTGYIVTEVLTGMQQNNLDATRLAIRALGESLNNLAMTNDYTSVRLCANHIGKVLELYIKEIKHRMPDGFFKYVMPDERYVPTWVEDELCDSMRDATDALMGRAGPALVINYLAERLQPFGRQAVEHGDLGAVEVLGRTYIEMGATERTFGVVTNFNIAPLYEAANLILAYAGQADKAESLKLLGASYFFLFTYVNYHTRGRKFTSSDHERFAKELKAAGVDFAEIARVSREKYAGYWNIRFADPDREQREALRKIRGL